MVGCGHTQCTVASGWRVCDLCGLVVGQEYEQVEWVPGIGDSRQRVSENTAWQPQQQTTVTTSLQRVHAGLGRPTRTKTLICGRDLISDICNRPELAFGSGVEASAIEIFQCARDEYHRCRGKGRMALVLACISLACMSCSVGVSDAEILDAASLDPKYRKNLNLQKKVVQTLYHRKNGHVIAQPNAGDYCVRICRIMNVSPQVTRLISQQAVRVAALEHLNAKSCRMIVAVSIIFLVRKRNLKIDISKLCHAMSMTRPTLIKWYTDASQNPSLKAVRRMINRIDTSL